MKLIKLFIVTDKPGKPGSPDITAIDETKVQLSWTPPRDDGGSEIINYVVEYRPEGAFKWKTAPMETITGTQYTVKNLDKDVTYEFRVAAENKAGVGPFSESTAPIKSKERVGKEIKILIIEMLCLKLPKLQLQV